MANTKITTDALADGAITSAKLGSGAVNTQVASYLSSNSFVDTTALNSAVSTAVSNLVGSAPSILDTLEELATSIGNSATLSSTLTSSIATKLPLAGGTLTGDLILGDSIKLELGAGTGGDLQLYHDGSHSYVTNTYASGALKLVSDDFRIENASNRNQLKTGVSGAVQLFFDDGSATGLRLGTTATGVDVTGNIVVSGTVDGVDIAARDAVLTSTTTTANAALPKAGGTMSGNIVMGDNNITGINKLEIFDSADNNRLEIYGNAINGFIFDMGGTGSTGTINFNDFNVGIGTISPRSPLHVAGNIELNSESTATSGDIDKLIFAKQHTSVGSGFYHLGEIRSWTNNGYGGGLDFYTGKHTGGGNYVATFAMRIDGDGNVGIGDDNPASKFTVDTAPNGNVPVAHIKQNAATNAPTLFIEQTGEGGNSNVNQGLLLKVDGNNSGYGNIIRAIGTNSNVNGGVDVEAFIVKNDGKVGIGTTNPNSLLELRKTTSGYITSGTGNKGAVLTLHHEAQWESAYGSGGSTPDWIGAIDFTTGDSSAGEGIRASIRTTVNNYYNTNDLVFYTANQGDTTLDERMRITNGGNVGIGTTAPTAPLEVFSGEIANGANKGIRIVSNGAVKKYSIRTGITGVENTSFAIHDDTASANRLVITTAGNVGIGTSNPAQNFVVAAATNGIGIELVPGTINYIQAYNRGTSDYGDLKIDAQTIRFGLDNGAEKVRIDSSGKVGIGIIAPATPLHVRNVGNPNSGGNRNTVETVLTLDSTGHYPYAGYGVGIDFKGEDYGNTALREYAKIQAVMTGSSDQNSSGDPSFKSALTFWTNNGGASGTLATEKMRISSDGNIVVQSATQNRIVLGSTGNSANNSSNWVRGNAGYLQFNSASAGYNWEIAGANKMTMDANGAVTFVASYIELNNSGTYTVTSATSGTAIRGAAVKFLRYSDHRTPTQSSMTHNHMGFGFTSYALNNTSPWADIIYLNSYGDTSGGSPNAIVVSKSGSNAKIVRYPFSTTSTTAISGGTQYGLDAASASDERLKENVNEITNGLAVINQLRPVTFNWNDTYIESGSSKNAEELEVESENDQSIKMPSSKVENVGLIAQEVEAVVPTVVHEGQISIGGVDYKNVDYKKLVPHLIAALQEADAKIEALTTRIEALET